MASNVFTKKEILQQLASKGYFIDIYTLDAFFAKKKIEAVFEDSQGNEFFDQNAINNLMEGLFSVAQNHSQALLDSSNNQPINPQIQQPQNTFNNPMPNIPNHQTSTQYAPLNNEEIKLDDTEAVDILNNISLSDGTPLINKVQDVQNTSVENNIPSQTQEKQPEITEKQNNVADIGLNSDFTQNKDVIAPQKNDIFSKEDLFDSSRDEIFSSDIPIDNYDSGNFDDATLLSESLEAQEKLRQYVVSELSKKNLDVTPQQQTASSLNNEFKLDISERTLNMIARTMAKKIAKYVGSIMAADAKQSSKVAEYQEENRRLTQKARELEEQNRQLRLLLAESNKNLNSYKPSIFGLYKKVDLKKSKK